MNSKMFHALIIMSLVVMLLITAYLIVLTR